jgi:hypothetical protein
LVIQLFEAVAAAKAPGLQESKAEAVSVSCGRHIGGLAIHFRRGAASQILLEQAMAPTSLGEQLRPRGQLSC